MTSYRKYSDVIVVIAVKLKVILPCLMMIFVRVYNDVIYINKFLILIVTCRFVLEVVQKLHTAHCDFKNCIFDIIAI